MLFLALETGNRELSYQTIQTISSLEISTKLKGLRQITILYATL